MQTFLLEVFFLTSRFATQATSGCVKTRKCGESLGLKTEVYEV